MLKGRIKTIVIYLLIIVIIIGISGTVVFYAMLNMWNNNSNLNTKAKDSKTNSYAKQEINLLLLGSDKERDGRRRSDTLMVANIDLTAKEISMLSIPRDTRVEFSDGSHHKINAAYAYGGLDLARDTVANFLGIDIDYYLELDYNGFVDLVDLIGGVEVDIAKNLQYKDRAAGLNIDLKAGRKKLTGTDALGYVRFRHDNLGDIGRITRQQKFLKSAADEILSTETLFNLPKLINKVRATIKTNLSMKDLLALSAMLKDFNSNQVKMNTLPGEIAYVNGISYWLVKKEEVNSILKSLNFNLIQQGGFLVNGA